jgi:Flp pilus assembly protein TadG
MNRARSRNFLGQNLVEYALLLPFMMFFIMVIFDLGRLTLFYSMLNNATREGARFGTVQDFACNTTAVSDVVKERLIGIDPTSPALSINVTWTNASLFGSPAICKPTTPGTAMVTIQAVYCFNPLTPFIESIIKANGGSGCGSGTLPVNSTTTMSLEM